MNKYAYRRARRPLRKRFMSPVAMLVGAGFAVGIAFTGGASTGMHVTNSREFCISCHEMEHNVYRDDLSNIHYTNASGVRASCADCHVPKDWTRMTIAKVRAAKDLYHKILGTVDTPEKFEARRLMMAERVWEEMKENDSRECRSCHDVQSMDFSAQDSRASRKHQAALSSGGTCIDCHKGVVHKLPDNYMEEDEAEA